MRSGTISIAVPYNYLIEKANQIEKMERQAVEYQSRIAQLEQESKQMQAQETQSQSQQPQAEISHEDDTLEAKIEAMVAKALQKYLPQQVTPDTHQEEATATQTKAAKPKPEQPEKDWESVKSEELRSSKARGASEERIYRAFKAVCDYNDVQPSNDTRWFIGNVMLRDLSGCNGMLVKGWIESHQTSVDDHNEKYGLGQYHNKRHKGVEAKDLIKW